MASKKIKKKGIRVGYSQSGEPQYYDGPGHAITVAATRMGKGRDIIVPAIIDDSLRDTSLVIVDPKGELASVTSKRRRQFGEVIYLDPYGLVAQLTQAPAPASRYNPMGRLQAGNVNFSVEAEKIADALIWEENGQNSTHWVSGARGLVSMCMMGLAAHAPQQNLKTLNSVRSIITGAFGNKVNTFRFAQEMIDNSTIQAIREKAAKFTVDGAKESRSLADIISTADVQTTFLSDAPLAHSLSASDFTFADARRKVLTVYIVLPMNYLDVCGKYFRLIVAAALSEFLDSAQGVPVLMLMDEFYQLGNLQAISNAFSMAAGYNVRLWCILQDLSQLAATYPQVGCAT